jgi:hypothetical protein
MQEAARWADRWFPTPTSNLEFQIAQFREMVVEAGRESEDVAVGVAATPADAEFIANCAAWGVDEISVALPSAGRDEVLTFLDDLVATRDLVLA